jgi:hypothetical protein
MQFCLVFQIVLYVVVLVPAIDHAATLLLCKLPSRQLAVQWAYYLASILFQRLELAVIRYMCTKKIEGFQSGQGQIQIVLPAYCFNDYG